MKRRRNKKGNKLTSRPIQKKLHQEYAPGIKKPKKLLRFLVVGVLNTFVGYTIYAACLFFGLHYSAAIGLATVLGVLFNFNSIGALVFNSKDKRKLPKFVAVYIFVYCINVISVGFLLFIGQPAWLGGLIMVLPLALISFYLNSRFVFRL
jgi:putative flippase GtrA